MSLALEWREGEYPAGGRGRAPAPARQQPRPRGQARARRRQRLVFLCFVGVAAFVSALFMLIICLQVMVAQNEMRARETERLIDLERRQHEAIRLEIASLESPSRIEELALGQLGMVRASCAEYLETPSYEAARAQEGRLSAGEEGMVSEATQSGF